MSRVQLALNVEDLQASVEEGVACCYARQDKVWVDGPSGEPWEIYTVLDDVEMPVGRLRTVDPSSAGDVCCAVVAGDEGATGRDGMTASTSDPACC